jgi:hypothetical protein
MNSKSKIYAGLALVILAAVALIILFLAKPKQTVTVYTCSVGPNVTYTFTYFNGSKRSFSLGNWTFLPGFSLTSFPAVYAGNTLETYNFSSIINSKRPRGDIEISWLYPNLRFSNQGIQNYSALVSYASNVVGGGDDVIVVFANGGNLTIYTSRNVCRITGGSFKGYAFLYGNSTMIPHIVAHGHTVNESAVPESSPVFPNQLLPFLDNVTRYSGLKFAYNGTWWYVANFTAQIS